MKLLTKRKLVAKQRPVLKIPGWIIRGQRKLSDYLQRKTKHWTKSQQQTALVVFLLLGSIGSIGIVGGAFSAKKHRPVIQTGRIVVPKIIEAGDEAYQSPGISNAATQIALLRKYLDSLVSSARGKQFRDSLQKQQPGLWDSLRIFHPISEPLK
jgi:hypothetical protein